MVTMVGKIRDRGISIIMIEHVMHAVMNVSDRIVVLDYGKLIAEGTPSEVSNNEKVIEAYLGDPKLAERLSIQPGAAGGD
jgi:branched-chain amino acid transport system ATP-binding protein